MRYAHNRQVFSKYPGATRSGPNKAWNPQNKSEDAILAHDRPTLMARARDLERGSPHISGAISKICNNVVYTGIFPQARIKTTDGKLMHEENSRIEGLHKEWAEHEWVDFHATAELVLRHLWIDGEVLVHSWYDDDLLEQGLCPLAFDVLESDYLDQHLNSSRLENGNIIKQGIEYNSKGRPVAYHLFKQHPGDAGPLGAMLTLERRRIPADEICHIFFRKRASQGRGVSWLASIIIEMRDFSEYQSSERIAARLASAFGAFVESPYPEHQMSHPLIGESQEGLPSVGDISKYFDPGRIDVLPPGMKINVAQYDRPGNSYEPYTKTSLKSASTGTGMSYENFSNDYEGATYSSARQAILEERRGYRKMQWFLVRNFLNWTWRKWTQHAHLAGNAGRMQKVPAKVSVQWQLPGWPWIDPAKDAKGAQIELEMKITNRRRLAAERGLDWDEELEELVEEEEILRKENMADKEDDNAPDNK